MDNFPNYRIERIGLKVRWIYVVYFYPKSLVQAMLEKSKWGVSRKAFYYLPNFGQISGRR